MSHKTEAEQIKYMWDHYHFIANTDRKSLHSQIKTLVQQAQEVALKELNDRRKALQKLLEYEDKIYEEEFSNSVKSRIDETIKERKDILLKIKEESTKAEQEFLKSKRIQQYMNSCYEIREALRHKEMQEVKECQLEQMLEKERAARAEQELDNYWYRVQQKNMEVADQRQEHEECMKRALVKHTNRTLKVQVDEAQERRDKILQEKEEEKQKLNAILEELRLEDFNQKHKKRSQKAIDYCQELFDMMAYKRMREKREEDERAETQRQIAAEAQRLMQEDAIKAMNKRREFQKATSEYIGYVKKMRELEKQQEQMYDARIKDLYRVDICTKANLTREQQRKARIAEECYAVLRKQICEQQERRLREEAEMHECKILENRFVHDDPTHAEILEKKRKNREGLDQQIAVLRRIREEEEAKFKIDLGRASNDPDFCSVLAERYIKEGIDYLEPHPNWSILACPKKKYVEKPRASSVSQLMDPETIGSSFQPCGCVARVKPDCQRPEGGGGDARTK